MTVSYPNETRNYCIFQPSIYERINRGERELPAIKASLKNPKNEDEIVEDLFILNCMLDNGVEGVHELYPELSKYNSTTSPNIQTFLAGIYRKTKIPDAFGPLVVMLIQNAIRGISVSSGTEAASSNVFTPVSFSTGTEAAIHSNTFTPFDPNEEIGGAILDYLA